MGILNLSLLGAGIALIAVGYLKKGITLLPRAFRRDITEFVGIDAYK